MRNTSTLDRIIRLLISLALFQLAFFWLAGGWQADTLPAKAGELKGSFVKVYLVRG